MFAEHPADGVGDLDALLVGIGGAIEVSGGAVGEAFGGDLYLGRFAVGGDGGFLRQRGARALAFEVMRELGRSDVLQPAAEAVSPVSGYGFDVKGAVAYRAAAAGYNGVGELAEGCTRWRVEVVAGEGERKGIVLACPQIQTGEA